MTFRNCATWENPYGDSTRIRSAQAANIAHCRPTTNRALTGGGFPRAVSPAALTRSTTVDAGRCHCTVPTCACGLARALSWRVYGPVDSVMQIIAALPSWLVGAAFKVLRGLRLR